jgi:hypothetical protein
VPILPGPPVTASHEWRIGYVVPARVSALTLDFVRCSVYSLLDGVPEDPTADAVAMAFTAVDVAPVSGNWRVAQWEGTRFASGFNAACLVGAGGTGALTAGRYSVWLRITDNPDAPIRSAGILVVY